MMTPPPRFRQDDQGDGHAGLDGDLFRHRPGPPARGAHAPSAFSTVTLLSAAALYGGRRALDGRNRRVSGRGAVHGGALPAGLLRRRLRREHVPVPAAGEITMGGNVNFMPHPRYISFVILHTKQTVLGDENDLMTAHGCRRSTARAAVGKRARAAKSSRSTAPPNAR